MSRISRHPRHLMVILVLALLGTLAAPAAHADTAPGSGSGPPSAGERWTLGGRECRPIAVPAAAPVGIGRCTGVRPGALVQNRVGACTMSFLFRGSDGHRYIATAGHCILGNSEPAVDAGERAWEPGNGPVARDGSNRKIGRFAYAVWSGEKDFALIRLKRGVAASPRMCHFGGPVGMNRERSSSWRLLRISGNGLAAGAVIPGRSLLATSMSDPDHVFAHGVAAPGDSGGPTTDASGRAVGVVVTVGVHLGEGLDSGVVGITRLPPQLRRAEAVMGTTLTLRTASL